MCRQATKTIPGFRPTGQPVAVQISFLTNLSILVALDFLSARDTRASLRFVHGHHLLHSQYRLKTDSPEENGDGQHTD